MIYYKSYNASPFSYHIIGYLQESYYSDTVCAVLKKSISSALNVCIYNGDRTPYSYVTAATSGTVISYTVTKYTDSACTLKTSEASYQNIQSTKCSGASDLVVSIFSSAVPPPKAGSGVVF